MAWYDAITNTPVYYNGDWSVPYWLKRPMMSWDASIPNGDLSHRILKQQYVIRYDDYIPQFFGTPHHEDPQAYLTEEQMTGFDIGQIATIDATYARIPIRSFIPSRYAWSDPNHGKTYRGAQAFFMPVLKTDDTTPDQVNLSLVTTPYSKIDASGVTYVTEYNQDEVNSFYYGDISKFAVGMNITVSIQDTPDATPNSIFSFKDIMRQPATKGSIIAVGDNVITITLTRPFTFNKGWVYRVTGRVDRSQFFNNTYPSLLMCDWFLPGVSPDIDNVLDIPSAQGFNPAAYVNEITGIFNGIDYYNFLSQDGWILIEPTGLDLWRGNIWRRTARYIRTKAEPELETVPMHFGTLPSP